LKETNFRSRSQEAAPPGLATYLSPIYCVDACDLVCLTESLWSASVYLTSTLVTMLLPPASCEDGESPYRTMSRAPFEEWRAMCIKQLRIWRVVQAEDPLSMILVILGRCSHPDKWLNCGRSPIVGGELRVARARAHTPDRDTCCAGPVLCSRDEPVMRRRFPPAALCSSSVNK